MHNDKARKNHTAGGLSGLSAALRALACAAPVAIAAVSMPACTGTICHLPAEPTTMETLAGQWSIASVHDEEIATLLPEGGKAPAITINTDGSITGFAGVNRVNGSVDPDMLARGKWQAKPFITTKMAGPPELMELEQKILSALQSTDTVMHTGGSVVLAANDKPLLALKPATE